MIKLYTDLKYFSSLEGGILSVDAYFNFNIVSSEIFSETILEVIRKYENAEVISETILNGRFGNYLLKEISTGVKTLILLILMDEGKLPKPPFINIFECGPNILPDVLYFIDKLNIPGFFKNSYLVTLDDFSGIVNDEYEFDTVLDLMSYLEKVD